MLNMAVIGLGHWGPNHVRNFDALDGCSVRYAVDTSVGALGKIKSRYPEVTCTQDVDAVLNDTRVHAVTVATPTGTHYAVVKAALEKGKHVLCEKPLAASSREAWELVSLSEKKQVCLMTGHVFLYNEGINYLVRAVAEQQAGPVYYVNAVRTNLGPFRHDVNAAWDLASHDIYIINRLLDARPLSVSATGASYLQEGIEDINFITLTYPGGVIGHVHVSWLDPRKVRQITVVGEDQMMVWDEFGTPGPVMIYDRSVEKKQDYENYGEFQMLAREGNAVIPFIRAREPLGSLDAAFIDACVNGMPDDFQGRGAQGAEVVDVLEAATQSLTRRGEEVYVSYGDQS